VRFVERQRSGSGGEVDVVVAGAGPAGSAAALLLAAIGRRVTVLEREPSVRAVGAGIVLQPNGLAVLYALGLRAALHERAWLIRSFPLRDERGRVLSDPPMPEFGAGLDHGLVLRRSHLAAVLEHALAADDRIELVTGAAVVSATPDGVVTFERDGRTTELPTRLVVAADGVGSKVRRTGGFSAAPVRAGHRYARMIVEGDEVPVGEYWTPLGLFGAARLGDGHTYGWTSLSDARVQAAVDGGDLTGYVARWCEVVPDAALLLGPLGGVDDLLVNEVGEVRCGTWVDGRTVLVGDAAHAMAPNLGQGANSALLDVAVLADELARRPDQAEALAAYERERRRPVTRVQRNAELLARVGHLRSPMGRRFRNGAVRALDRPALLTRQVRTVQQVDPRRVFEMVSTLAGTA
jgi:2-polyprenyl-6-methoxyphenol hydroxylase-like FAD-dependent oxidoreductase